MEKRAFTLLLAMSPGIGSRTLLRIITRNDVLGRGPKEFLALGEAALREEYRLSAKAAQEFVLNRKSLVDSAKQTYERLGSLGVVWSAITEASYPERLIHFELDPPSVLFIYGNHGLLKGRTFSVLSSRNATARQLAQIETLVEMGTLTGEVLVTGHDKPEYQRAAVVPLRWGAPRILCLDRGLFQVLGPDLKNEISRTARLWRYEFDPTSDLVISPFRPESAMVGSNNRVRDRLVAGLSDRIDFVNVASGGNMDKILRQALTSGRPIAVDAQSEAAAPYTQSGAKTWSL
jgi:DNA processing protein